MLGGSHQCPFPIVLEGMENAPVGAFLLVRVLVCTPVMPKRPSSACPCGEPRAGSGKPRQPRARDVPVGAGGSAPLPEPPGSSPGPWGSSDPVLYPRSFSPPACVQCGFRRILYQFPGKKKKKKRSLVPKLEEPRWLPGISHTMNPGKNPHSPFSSCSLPRASPWGRGRGQCGDSDAVQPGWRGACPCCHLSIPTEHTLSSPGSQGTSQVPVL